jgi:predicted enzyme related to lactoylglutathione lyase
MITKIANFALLVKDYDEAINFYCGKLGFCVREDTQFGNKRWVRISPNADGGTEILLSKASSPSQLLVVGNQASGRVLFFIHTDDFDNDYEKFCSLGVEFVEPPRDELYGKVAVFRDLYGNRIDLIEPRNQ